MKQATIYREEPSCTQAKKPQRVTAARILDIATQLEKNLRMAGANGNGLHQLIGSIPLPACIRRAARAIASIRNKAVHEANFNLGSDLPDDFWDLVEEVNQWLHLAKQRAGVKISDLSLEKATPKRVVPKKAPAKKIPKPAAIRPPAKK